MEVSKICHLGKGLNVMANIKGFYLQIGRQSGRQTDKQKDKNLSSLVHKRGLFRIHNPFQRVMLNLVSGTKRAISTQCLINTHYIVIC